MGSLKDLGALKVQIENSALTEALTLVKQGRPIDGADRLDRLTLSQQQRTENAALLAEAYYRRGVCRHSAGTTQAALSDLEKALGFPGLPPSMRATIQGRLTSIQKAGRSSAIRDLDKTIEGYFEGSISQAGVLGEFMAKYRLSKPHRELSIAFLDGVSSVSVYRWQGDQNYGETWTRLIRSAKSGQPEVISLLARILAEHFRETPLCREWLGEIDFVVPVPSDRQRSAARSIDVVRTVADQFGDRLGLPLRADFLRRTAGSEHSRHLSRGKLGAQYTLEERKAGDVRGRIVLLIDDVVTQGYTASICAERLKAAGAAKVHLLTLAQAESTHREQQHFGETLDKDAHDLAPWLCLADTEKLGPVRLKSLLKRFSDPAEILEASEAELRNVQDIGPKLATAIAAQAPKLDEYAIKAAAILDSARELGAQVLTLADPGYPTVLRGSNAAPAVVYYLGSKSVASATNTIAIVGSRRPTAAAVEAAGKIAKAFAAAGWVVVSGMAEGVDCLSHKACLDAGQETMAFLGNGVNLVYPPSAKGLRLEIMRHGALLSEYPFGTRVNENQLRRRNRLIVGAARAVVIIQTKTDGGTMNSARAAKDLGRPVFCLEPPSDTAAEFSGNQELLRSGAASVIDTLNPVDVVSAALQRHEH